MKLVDSSACLGDRNSFPPGFRFHPTDEELVLYYLKRKICGRRLKLDIIGETDVYKWDPEDLPGQSKLKTGDRQWFFFSPRDRKYPNGGRSNRATRYGYWKATGKDRVIKYYTRHVGTKKTLVFYQGRAPAGVRTDWVMHEYTLDEEELRKCHSVQDYYALYKVYKKSGPGPKNGEQYGAPFQEEDWADDDCLTVNGHTLSDNPTGQVDDVTSIYNSRCNTQLQSPLHDLEEFANQVRDETVLATDYTLDFQQLISEEETQTPMVDSSSRETNLPVQSAVLHSSSQPFDVQAKFDLTQSATSELQPYEASEVISASNTNRQEPHVAEDDLLEDFLEINDLVGPQPTVPSIQNAGSNLQSEEIDGLSEFDLFHDAAMFLHDSGLAPGLISQSYLNCLESGPVNPVSSSYLNYPENEIANQVPESYLNNLEKDMVNPLNCQLQPHPNDYLEKDMVTLLNWQLQPPHINNENQINGELWVHDQISNIYRPAESNHGSLPPPNSGVLYAGNSENLPPEDQPKLNLVEDDGTESWFSSALWSFVESIPTTPASASENALVNRALLRMSSFGRASINAVNKNVTAGNLSTTVRKSGKCNRGIFCFSVLGVVCAILWVIMGTSVKVLGRYIPS